jgi:hypothetical protein
MKNGFVCAVWVVAAAALATLPIRAGIIFQDDFAAGPSPLWGNESGAWTASAGSYYASEPNNAPNAYSSLPFNLTAFTVDFDINAVSDGGIFLRAEPKPGTTFGIQGVLLNFKVPAGGPRLYWHIFYDGTNASGPLNLTYLDYGNTPHVHVEVIGDTYSAYINGSTEPATAFTTSLFPTGRVALYDYSGQSFSNFVLAKAQPTLGIRMEPDAAVLYWSTGFPDYVLQTSADLSPTGQWFTLGGPYALANGSYQVRLPLLNLLHKQFFRLRYNGS